MPSPIALPNPNPASSSVSGTAAGASPLDQLADIHLPDPVSVWPLAPGWWLLLALLLALGVGVALWRRRQRRYAFRAQALRELDAIYTRLAEHQQPATYLQELNRLLKRLAFTSYGQAFDPSLKGLAWLAWLDSSCPKLPGRFTDAGANLLVAGLYQAAPEGDIAGLQALARAWVRTHPRRLSRHLKQPQQPKVAEAQTDV